MRVPRGQRGAAALRVRGGGGAAQCEVVVVVLDLQAEVYRGAAAAAGAGAVPTAYGPAGGGRGVAAGGLEPRGCAVGKR